MTSTNEPLTTEQLFSRTKQRRQLLIKRQAVALAVAVFLAVLLWMKALEPLERVFLDAWLSRPQKETVSGVVLIPISKKSIDQIGEWPWPPFRYAVMLELLERFGARSVYIDAVFSESPGSEEDLKPLTAVLEKHSLPVFFAADFMPRFENTGPGLAVLNQPASSGEEWALPVSAIRNHSFFGHRQLKLGQDRVFRFWQPGLSGQGAVYPFTALKMAEEIKKDGPLIEATPSQNRLIPWNRASFENWPRVEFSDLMQSYLAMRESMQPTVAPQLFKGRDVFIGLADEVRTLSGLTPWRQNIFPYEVTAMVFDGLMSAESSSVRAVASVWAAWIFFSSLALFFIFWTGLRTGRLFWLGWAGLFLMTGLVWAIAVQWGIWLPCALTVFFLGMAGLAIFIFDALHARQERSALFHLATRDGLTGLYVIRHFRVIMNQMTREARARKESLAVILMDIDHFKKINDTYGHPAGDMVLKKTAEVILGAVRQKRALKEIDFVARYGGEEFIILVRRNSLEDAALRVAERIRAALQQTHYEWQGTKISVTASFGVAALGENENIPDALVHRADKALYVAKQTGRNRVCTEKEITK